MARTGAASKTEPGDKCDDSLWHHVYHPERLIVHMMCVQVTGTIVDASGGRHKDGVRHEADGDTHGWLRLDPGQEQFTNKGNADWEQGNLVYEIVCAFPVKQQDAVSACAGYQNKVILPGVGKHVRMWGSWVQDTNHGKWQELHPVAAIDILDN